MSHTRWSCQRLFLLAVNFNPFSRIFVRFTIVNLTWDDSTSYSIVLPMHFSAQVFPASSIYFRCIIDVTTQFAYTGYGIVVLWGLIFLTRLFVRLFGFYSIR